MAIAYKECIRLVSSSKLSDVQRYGSPAHLVDRSAAIKIDNIDGLFLSNPMTAIFRLLMNEWIERPVNKRAVISLDNV